MAICQVCGNDAGYMYSVCSNCKAVATGDAVEPASPRISSKQGVQRDGKESTNLLLAGFVIFRLFCFVVLVLAWSIANTFIRDQRVAGALPAIALAAPFVYIGHRFIFKLRGGKIAIAIVLCAIAALGIWASFLR